MKKLTDTEIFDRLRGFKTLKELRDGDRGLLSTIRRRGKDFMALCMKNISRHTNKDGSVHKPAGFWRSDEGMKYVYESASDCHTFSEWQDVDMQSYNAAQRLGILKDVTKAFVRTVSYGEYTIQKLLLEYDVPFKHQKRFNDCRNINPLPFDFYLEQFNLLLEYQGEQHSRNEKGRLFGNLEDIQKRDTIKREFAHANGFNYLEIDYTDFTNIEAILLDKLKSLSPKPLQPVKRELTKDELSKLSLRGRWNKEKVLDLAVECGSLSLINKDFRGAVNYAKKHKFWHEVVTITGKVTDRERWSTKDKIIAAIKSANITSMEGWRKADEGYCAAVNRGWLKEIELDLGLTRKRTPNGFWTAKLIFEKFAKYENRKAMINSVDRLAYSAAAWHKLLPEASRHFIPLKARLRTAKEILLTTDNYKKGEYLKWMNENKKHYEVASKKKLLPKIHALLD